jgi:putative transposase
MVTPGAKRDAVAHARGCYGLSERRACHLIGIARRVARYQPSRPDDTDLRQRLRELAAVRRRFGYRRLGYLLAREGLKPNHKKLLRLYREGGAKATSPRRPETGARHQGANGGAAGAEPALVVGLCL